MGLGSTAKKVQKLGDVAEQVHARVTALREELSQVRETVDETGRRVEAIEDELDEQRALLDALAEQQGLDPEAVAAGDETEAEAGAAED
jgi:septal ring factor EnvC (AmiA/AmiB activator)